MHPDPLPPPLPDQSANISAIEVLRGIAATVVCLFHFTHGNNTFISDGHWIKTLFSKGWLGVEIFFVISGFIIPYSMARSKYQLRNFPLFVLKRWARLDPPYLLSIIFILALNTASALVQGENYTPNLTRLFLHIGYLIPFFPPYQWLSGVYWTLAVESQYYLLVGLLYPLLHHPQRIYFWLIALGLLALGAFTKHPGFFFDYCMYFVLGFALFKRFEKRLSQWEFYLVSGLAFAAILYKYNVPYVLAGLIPWMIIAFFPKLKCRSLRWLGMISYSIYLIHLPLGKKIIPWAGHYIHGDWSRLGFLFLLFGFTLGVAYGFYYLIERPAMHWSKFFTYGKKSIKKYNP